MGIIPSSDPSSPEIMLQPVPQQREDCGRCGRLVKANGADLLELSRLLLAASYREVLNIAVRKGAEMTGCEGCCIIIENRKGDLIQKAGFPEGYFDLGREAGPSCIRFFREVISKGADILSVLNSWDTRETWLRNLSLGLNGSHQLLCAPLFYRGESLGILIFSFGTPADQRRFSAENLERLRAVSMLVSAAMGAAYAKMRDEKEMARRERLSMLGENSASVAHTIRNSLTSIGGFAKRLESKLSGDRIDPEQVGWARQYAGIISAEVSKLESITRSVLTYARFSTQRLNMASCSISEYLRGMVDLFSSRYPGVGLEYAQDRRDVTLQIDTAALGVCIEDVIRNAVEAGARNVFIKTKIKPKEQRLLISIVNDGDEICPSILDKIFDPFMTTKPDGTGLGLANVKAIVAAHGGEVTVSSMNRKTEFHIFLPIA